MEGGRDVDGVGDVVVDYGDDVDDGVGADDVSDG